MKIEIGDIVLTRKIKNFKLVSDVICWRQNSKIASHIAPIVDIDKLQIVNTIMLKKIYLENLEKYFNGEFYITILRIKNGLSDDEKEIFSTFAKSKIGLKYDIKSILGIIINKKIESSKKLNCGELTLQCFQKINYLTKRENDLILPHSFWEYYIANQFDLIYQKRHPTKDDLQIFK